MRRSRSASAFVSSLSAAASLASIVAIISPQYPSTTAAPAKQPRGPSCREERGARPAAERQSERFKNWSRAAATTDCAMALRVRRAGPKPSGPWRPGMRVIDDSCDRLGADLVRRLLESPDVLPEHERWTPTRWLMKAVYEAVHGKGAALSTLMSSLRSESDNKAHVVDLYRKLSADYASSSDEVSGAGGRAHGRCERSYVFSSQLRHWLHEVSAHDTMRSQVWELPRNPARGSAML